MSTNEREMRIKQLIDRNKKIFSVTANSRSRSKKVYALKSDIINALKNDYDLQNYIFVSELSDGDLTKWENTGRYVFEIDKEISVDNEKNYVKIDQIVEAASPQVEEQKKEASLPYGLKKQTKAKKKRATRKTTEE